MNPQSLDFTGFSGFRTSLPFYGCGGFRGDVVGDAVDAGYFVDDADGDPVEYVVGYSCPVCGHEVAGGDCAQGEHVVVGAAVSHDADRTAVGENCEVLADAAVQTCFGDFLTIYVVGFTQDVGFFFGHITDDADGKTGTREWLAHDEVFGQTKLTAQLAHFILEKQ